MQITPTQKEFVKVLKEKTYLFVKSDTLLLVDVFYNFQSTCIGINVLDSAHFLSTPGSA